MGRSFAVVLVVLTGACGARPDISVYDDGGAGGEGGEDGPGADADPFAPPVGWACADVRYDGCDAVGSDDPAEVGYPRDRAFFAWACGTGRGQRLVAASRVFGAGPADVYSVCEERCASDRTCRIVRAWGVDRAYEEPTLFAEGDNGACRELATAAVPAAGFYADVFLLSAWNVGKAVPYCAEWVQVGR